MSTRRALIALLAGVALGARAQNPFLEAARESAAPAPPAATPVAALVQAFVDGCVAHEGDATATVDWAIVKGFEPIEAQSSAAAALLAGRPGTVLALPGSSGQALLVIETEAQRCTVWAERADGPALRSAFVQAINTLVAGGARAQPVQERRLERAGAWRLQLQWRLRRAGSDKERTVGSVTTLGAAPTAQVLSAGPGASATPVAPAASAAGPTAAR